LEKKKLFSQLSSIKKEIEDIHMDIDFLGNLSKNTYFQQKFSNLNNTNLITPLRKRNSSENVNNYDKMMMMKKFIDVKQKKLIFNIIIFRKKQIKKK